MLFQHINVRKKVWETYGFETIRQGARILGPGLKIKGYFFITIFLEAGIDF